MTNCDLPKAPINRMFKEAGGNRLSVKARDLIMADLENYTKCLIQDSIKISKHAGRRTVMADDVLLAQKMM